MFFFLVSEIIADEIGDVDIEESYDADVEDIDGATGADDEEESMEVTDDSNQILRKHNG